MKKINIYPNSGNRVYVNDLQDINNDIISTFGRAFGPQFDGLKPDEPFFISGGEWSGYMVNENPSSLFWTSGLVYWNGNIYNIAQSAPTNLGDPMNVYGYGANESQRNPESGNPYFWNTNYLGYYAAAPRDASHILLFSGINLVANPLGVPDYNFHHFNPYFIRKKFDRDVTALLNKTEANATNIATNATNIATNTAAIATLEPRIPSVAQLTVTPLISSGVSVLGTAYTTTLLGNFPGNLLIMNIQVAITATIPKSTPFLSLAAPAGRDLGWIRGSVVAAYMQGSGNSNTSLTCNITQAQAIQPGRFSCDIQDLPTGYLYIQGTFPTR